MVLASSFFAVLGVAMVAQWSILSNITASITIFFAFPYKIGDRIRILDKDDSVTGIITEIGLFYVRVRDDNGDLVTYPANLILQKPVRRLEERRLSPRSRNEKRLPRGAFFDGCSAFEEAVEVLDLDGAVGHQVDVVPCLLGGRETHGAPQGVRHHVEVAVLPLNSTIQPGRRCRA